MRKYSSASEFVTLTVHFRTLTNRAVPKRTLPDRYFFGGYHLNRSPFTGPYRFYFFAKARSRPLDALIISVFWFKA